MESLFNMSADTGIVIPEDSGSNGVDGLYRPKVANSIDKKNGYQATIRFLPNVRNVDGSPIIEQSIIEKSTIFVKLAEYPDLNGVYDSLMNFKELCPLLSLRKKLKNSASVVDQEKAQCLSFSNKFYSYIQIIEDKNAPELEGKIMIFSYGAKIKEKIDMERTGQVTKKTCNVFRPQDGKDFVLIVKGERDRTNYDLCSFVPEQSAIKLLNKDGQLKEVPTETIDGKLVISPKYESKVTEYLMNRPAELSDFAPKRWTDAVKTKVDNIVSILTDNPIIKGKDTIQNAKQSTSYQATTEVETQNEEDFFDDF